MTGDVGQARDVPKVGRDVYATGCPSVAAALLAVAAPEPTDPAS